MPPLTQTTCALPRAHLMKGAPPAGSENLQPSSRWWITSVLGSRAGESRILATFWPLQEALVRNPDVSTSASGRAPAATPSAARNVPRLVAITVTVRLIFAM